MWFYPLKELDKERTLLFKILAISCGIHIAVLAFISIKSYRSPVSTLVLSNKNSSPASIYFASANRSQKSGPLSCNKNNINGKQTVPQSITNAEPPINAVKQTAQAILKPALSKNSTKKVEPAVVKKNIEVPKRTQLVKTYSKLLRTKPETIEKKPAEKSEKKAIESTPQVLKKDKVEKKLVEKEKVIEPIIEAKKIIKEIQNTPEDKPVAEKIKQQVTQQIEAVAQELNQDPIVLDSAYGVTDNLAQVDQYTNQAQATWQTTMQAHMINLLAIPSGFEHREPTFVSVKIDVTGVSIIEEKGCTIPAVRAAIRNLLLTFDYPPEAYGRILSFKIS